MHIWLFVQSPNELAHFHMSITTHIHHTFLSRYMRYTMTENYPQTLFNRSTLSHSNGYFMKLKNAMKIQFFFRSFFSRMKRYRSLFEDFFFIVGIFRWYSIGDVHINSKMECFSECLWNWFGQLFPGEIWKCSNGTFNLVWAGGRLGQSYLFA